MHHKLIINTKVYILVKTLAFPIFTGEPGVSYNITEIEHLKHEDKKMKKKLHISSNLTKHLELELEQLKEEHQNLNLDYQQLRSDHQNLTLDHKKLKESHKQLKDLMYTYMGGYFKC